MKTMRYDTVEGYELISYCLHSLAFALAHRVDYSRAQLIGLLPLTCLLRRALLCRLVNNEKKYAKNLIWYQNHQLITSTHG